MENPPIKILLVDDQANNLRVLSNILNQQGYKVQRAISGQLALNAAIAAPPDLILLDIMMPEMNGYEVCKQLKAKVKTQEIPVIFISGLDEAIDKIKAFEVGGVDYITKPFEVEEVLARIENQLTIKNLQKQLKEKNKNLQKEISKRQKIEKALRQAHQVLSFHIENTPLAVVEWNSELRVKRWSQQAEKIFGWKAEEVIGKNPFEDWQFVWEADLEKAKIIVDRLVKGKDHRNVCCKRNYTKSGTVLHCEWYNSILLDEKGQVVSIFSLVLDVSDRTATEAALRESEERFRALFEQAAVGIAQVSLSGKFLRVNPGFCQIVGYKESELLSRTVQEITEPNMSESNDECVRQLLAGEIQTFSIEKCFICKNGQIKWVYLTASVVREASGAPQYCIGAIEDISERKLAEQKLQASEERYRIVSELISDYAYAIELNSDGKMKLLWITDAFSRISGFSPEQLETQDWKVAIYPDDLPIAVRRFQNLLSGQPDISEYRIITKSGEIRWLRDYGRPIGTGDCLEGTGYKEPGNLNPQSPIPNFQPPLLIYGGAQDITEEKQVLAEKERQLQYQQLLTSVTLKIREFFHISEILSITVRELQTTLQADRVLFVRLLPESGAKVVNEAVTSGFSSMQELFVKNEYLLLQYLEQYFDKRIQVCYDVEAASLNPGYLEFMRKYQIRSHLNVPILVTGDREQQTPNSLSFISNQRLWGLLCVHQCSSAREWLPLEIQLLQQLANQLSIALYQAQLLETETRQRQELTRSNAELEKFAYVASHDLQAPLGTIASYAQLLERRLKDNIDPQANKFINQIVSGCDRMQRLIDDLLEYSRVGKKNKLFDATDCNRVFEEACANLQSAIRRNQAVVTKDNLPTIVADTSQLIQLFQNLIGNAIKYRRDEPPAIHVSVSLKNDDWLFCVRDNGIGIDPKHSKRIFEIFQRLHTQEEYSGTGIGLAICKKIVERHGGRIWVESQQERGASFCFTFPYRNL